MHTFTRNLISKANLFRNPFSHPDLTHTQLYCYHMSYLMDSKYDDRFVKIDRKAFHLYKDSILKFKQNKFNQKIFLTVLIDAVRTKQKYQDFQQLAEYGLRQVNLIKQPISIFSFATQLYLYNYPNKQNSYKLAKRGFQFFQQNAKMKFSSYYVMKFLIFIQKNVGLQRFTDQDYKKINFTRFKPLFLCFTLEMFYQNNLQHYQTIQHIFEIFTSNLKIVPFADIHHYRLATKKIDDPRFKDFTEKLGKHLMEERPGKQGQVAQIQGQPQLNIEPNEDGEGQFNQNGFDGRSGHNQSIGQKKSFNEKTSSNERKLIKQRSSPSLSCSQSILQFPWQKAYQKQILRRYTYHPSILSSIGSKTITDTSSSHKSQPSNDSEHQ